MKTYYRSLIFGLLAIIAMPAIAQEDDYFEFFGEDREMDNLPTSILLEDRVPIKYNNPRADDIIWQKVVYRVIDLREKINYPLYFPEEAGDNRQSLFTTIFRLFEEGKIKCYNYLDNKEIFGFRRFRKILQHPAHRKNRLDYGRHLEHRDSRERYL